jgi:hypothetical protein
LEEWDPRVELKLEPNFYYPQEDYLWEFCSKNKIGWNIAIPSTILGAVPDAAMNLCFPLGVYATICLHLGQPLVFPGDMVSWQSPYDQSAAKLNAYLEEWAVLSPNTANERFNAINDSAFTWESFWPRFAGWYGLDWEAPGVFGKVGPNGEVEGMEVQEVGQYDPPRGYGPKRVVKHMFKLEEWAKREEVQKAWHEIAQKFGLEHNALAEPDRVFRFADGCLLRTEPLFVR